MAPGDALDLSGFGISYWGVPHLGFLSQLWGPPSETVLSSSPGPPPLGLTLTFFAVNYLPAELVGMVNSVSDPCQSG